MCVEQHVVDYSKVKETSCAAFVERLRPFLEDDFFAVVHEIALEMPRAIRD